MYILSQKYTKSATNISGTRHNFD